MSNEELEVEIRHYLLFFSRNLHHFCREQSDHSGSKIVSVIFFPIQKSPRPQLVFGTGCGRGVFILL